MGAIRAINQAKKPSIALALGAFGKFLGGLARGDGQTASSKGLGDCSRAMLRAAENHGVQLHDTPVDYFSEYMNAAQAALENAAAENEFFAEVWQSQRDFAEIAVPFWAGAQTSNANLGKAFADSLK